ncbi:MAG: hypothetical protein H2058_13905 [Muricauda sp.]|nr:hypothetical protein [Allomuricauda sp.]MBA4746345.1 hypothetical protein [Allomuricauda sp.]MCR9228431.1 hypothetical protein [Flavobacteriaceae bacterium]
MKTIRQHSDDGDMVIDISSVNAARLSDDGFNAEVLLSDGNWIRLNCLYSKLKPLIQK